MEGKLDGRSGFPVQIYCNSMFNCFLRKTVFEIVTDSGEMEDGDIERNIQKTTIDYIHIDVFQGTAQRWNVIDVVN